MFYYFWRENYEKRTQIPRIRIQLYKKNSFNLIKLWQIQLSPQIGKVKHI